MLSSIIYYKVNALYSPNFLQPPTKHQSDLIEFYKISIYVKYTLFYKCFMSI